MLPPPPRSTLFPYTTLFRSAQLHPRHRHAVPMAARSPERDGPGDEPSIRPGDDHHYRSEEHTSELQSHSDLVCRLLLEKKKHHTTTFAQQTGYDAALHANLS